MSCFQSGVGLFDVKIVFDYLTTCFNTGPLVSNRLHNPTSVTGSERAASDVKAVAYSAETTDG